MTKQLAKRFFAIPLFVILLAGLGVCTSAWAIDLQTAKAQGLVGEQPDGYLGLVSANAGADVKAMMDDINSKRKALYQGIAQSNKTKLSVVENLAGAKAINKTPAGQYIKSPAGTWQKK
ncbi:MAG: YdbL family protein [Gammaproteobacteria bacterium]|nr:YdbL family protein [Gammaproteobacteria bacterium]MDH5653804.1 YdbL family protein [Gammaproteobacteria bacterium]